MSELPMRKVWPGYVLFHNYQLAWLSIECSKTKTKSITYQLDYSAQTVMKPTPTPDYSPHSIGNHPINVDSLFVQLHYRRMS